MTAMLIPRPDEISEHGGLNHVIGAENEIVMQQEKNEGTVNGCEVEIAETDYFEGGINTESYGRASEGGEKGR